MAMRGRWRAVGDVGGVRGGCRRKSQVWLIEGQKRGGTGERMTISWGVRATAVTIVGDCMEGRWRCS